MKPGACGRSGFAILSIRTGCHCQPSGLRTVYFTKTDGAGIEKVAAALLSLWATSIIVTFLQRSKMTMVIVN